MATKKLVPKKATKKATKKNAKPIIKKKEPKQDSLDFEFKIVGKANKSNTYDIEIKMEGNKFATAVALGSLMHEDEELENLLKLAVEEFLWIKKKKKATPKSQLLKKKKK